MRLDRTRAEGVLKDPGGFTAVVLFGPDAGLVRERANALTLRVAGALDDPFRIAELPAAAAARLGAELSSVPLTGGRRVVRVRDAGDAVTGPLTEALRVGPDQGLAIIEAGDLGPKSRLRLLAEKDKAIAAIRCFPMEGQALQTHVRQFLQEHGVSAEDVVLRFVCENLPTDSGARLQELAKLVQMAGTGARLSVPDAALSLGIEMEDRTDMTVSAALSGLAMAADAGIEESLAAGAAPVAMMRAALRQTLRLQVLRAAMDDGASAEQAMERIFPPVFERDRKDLGQAARRWSSPTLATAACMLLAAERRVKSGEPEAAVIRQALRALAAARAS